MTRRRPGATDGDSDILKLASDFPKVSDEDWLKLIDRVLKGAPFDERLVSHSDDGIAIRPLYTGADWPSEADPSGFPGTLPFTRGFRAANAVVTGGDLRALQANPDRRAAGREVVADIAGGATSLLLRLDEAGRRGRDGDDPLAGHGGLMISGLVDLEGLLAGVDLESIAVSLDSGVGFFPAAAMLVALWRRRGVALEKVSGSLNADPLGALATVGTSGSAMAEALGRTVALARYADRYLPGVRSVGVSAIGYHDAGAGEAQELAFSIATGVAYLRALTDAGLSVDAAMGQVAFSFALDADVFLSIAKIRAVRRLWGRVGEACGSTTAARRTCVHVQTSARMMARRDPWVNMLRTTAACFAAAVSDADSVTVLPFDVAFRLPDDFARRIARNTQLMLREESSLNRVIDPAGGAWALENLTEVLAQRAWSLFQEIERIGGMPAALANGSVAAMVEETWHGRERNIALRVDPLTGLSAFPDLAEPSLPSDPADIDGLRARESKRLPALRRSDQARRAVEDLRRAKETERFDAAIIAVEAGATMGMLMEALNDGEALAIAPLPKRRLGEAFEALRARSDRHLDVTGQRPSVCLVTLGRLAEYGEAAAFARNLLAAGGIDVSVGLDASDTDTALRSFRECGGSVAVLCSDQTLYDRRATVLIDKLRSAGATAVFAVGRADQLAGKLDGSLYEGCDVLAVLNDLHGRLGVGNE